MCIIYTTLPVILIMFIPESPPWLVAKGRLEQARKSLEWLHKYQPKIENKVKDNDNVISCNVKLIEYELSVLVGIVCRIAIERIS